METREITQVRIYKLWMHDMRASDIQLQIVAIAYDKQKLIQWYRAELASERYEERLRANETDQGLAVEGKDKDTYITKHFKKGSPIEWFDAVDNIEEFDLKRGMGINDSWTTQEHIDATTAVSKEMLFIDKIYAE